MLTGIKQTEHQMDYNKCWAFFFFFCCAFRAHPGGFIFLSSPPPPITNSPVQDPHLLVNHHPGAMGWRERETEEDESEGG